MEFGFAGLFLYVVITEKQKEFCAACGCKKIYMIKERFISFISFTIVDGYVWMFACAPGEDKTDKYVNFFNSLMLHKCILTLIK